MSSESLPTSPSKSCRASNKSLFTALFERWVLVITSCALSSITPNCAMFWSSSSMFPFAMSSLWSASTSLSCALESFCSVSSRSASAAASSAPTPSSCSRCSSIVSRISLSLAIMAGSDCADSSSAITWLSVKSTESIALFTTSTWLRSPWIVARYFLIFSFTESVSLSVSAIPVFPSP